MRNRMDILGVPVDNVTMGEAVERLKAFLSEDKMHAIYTPNSLIIMEAQRDPYLKSLLACADLLVPDGAGVLLAARILGGRLKEKVSGYDLVKNAFILSSKMKIRFFFLGGKPGVAEIAREKVLALYPWVEIAGCQDGYFSREEENTILDRINASGADMLFVALGAPKQEKFIHTHREDLNVRVAIGVGGVLDAFAGNTRLAPEFFRKNGLEWLYRMLNQPARFKKFPDLLKFLMLSAGARLRLK